MNILYKCLPEDKAPNGHKYELNKWYKLKGELKICNNGFHASKNIIDAMGYVTPGYVAKVEVRGESQIQEDKECWSEIRIVSWKKWTKKDSVALSIFAAELVLENYEKKYREDTRPRDAIEAAKKVLKNNNAKNRSAAWSAARSAENAASAAWSAAASAESAAASAAASAASAAASAERSAERSAASAAASAERSAESAAWSAAASAAWSAESAAASAESAARSAAESAASAESAVFTKCHNFVIERKGL